MSNMNINGINAKYYKINTLLVLVTCKNVLVLSPVGYLKSLLEDILGTFFSITLKVSSFLTF